MPKNPIVFTLDGRRCTCLLPEGKPKRLYVLCGWEMGKLMILLAEDAPEVLFFSTEIDGGRDSTPMGSGAPFGPAGAVSGGGKTEPISARRRNPKTVRCWGTLGGLFALWALTKTEKFGAGASLSGSLWYPQF